MAVGDGSALRTLSLASQLLQWIGYGSGRWVGFEDAFAGKPAPTVDRVWPCSPAALDLDLDLDLPAPSGG
jgi:hypothetical protein